MSDEWLDTILEVKGGGQHDDYTQSDDWRPEIVSRGEK